MQVRRKVHFSSDNNRETACGMERKHRYTRHGRQSSKLVPETASDQQRFLNREIEGLCVSCFRALIRDFTLAA